MPQTTRKNHTKGTVRPEDAAAIADLQDFAHHLAEALRIARYSPMIPASLYGSAKKVMLGL